MARLTVDTRRTSGRSGNMMSARISSRAATTGWLAWGIALKVKTSARAGASIPFIFVEWQAGQIGAGGWRGGHDRRKPGTAACVRSTPPRIGIVHGRRRTRHQVGKSARCRPRITALVGKTPSPPVTRQVRASATATSMCRGFAARPRSPNSCRGHRPRKAGHRMYSAAGDRRATEWRRSRRIAALASRAEAVILQRHQDQARKVIVDLGDVDVLRIKFRMGEQFAGYFPFVEA